MKNFIRKVGSVTPQSAKTQVLLFALLLGSTGCSDGVSAAASGPDIPANPSSADGKEAQDFQEPPVPAHGIAPAVGEHDASRTDASEHEASSSDGNVEQNDEPVPEALLLCVTLKDCPDGMLCSAETTPSRCVEGERPELGPLGQAPPPIGLFEPPLGGAR